MSSPPSPPGGTCSPDDVSHRLPPAPAVRYGTHDEQVANLHLPAGEGGPWPAVMLIHGGFWRERWDRTLTTPLAHDLAARGYAVWNVEYRRVGHEEGGYPGTLGDVAAALAALARLPEVDPERIVAVGHSAGGHLALWLAGERSAGARLAAAVSLAGVADLRQAYSDRLGDGAVAAFLGEVTGEELDARLRAASPLERLGSIPRALVHGTLDDVVPVSQSRDYAARVGAAGIAVDLVELDGADHFDVVDPGGPAWQAVAGAIARLVPPRGAILGR